MDILAVRRSIGGTGEELENSVPVLLSTEPMNAEKWQKSLNMHSTSCSKCWGTDRLLLILSCNKKGILDKQACGAW